MRAVITGGAGFVGSPRPGLEDLRRRAPDVRKAARVTGFRPHVSLNEPPERVTGHLRGTGRG